MAKISPKSGSLSTIICSYKSAVTRSIRKHHNPIFAWQSRFFDHVIRIENSMANIQNYIIQNPANWKQDKNKIETIFMTNLSILTDSK